jgi:PPK2 family polyphosphate:nucleotide phosphotransferase
MATHLDPTASPFLVPFDGSFRMGDASSEPPDDAPKKKENEAALEELVERMDSLQRKLAADDRWSLLLVFQAMDAAGKDGTMRAVTRGLNPAGFQTFNFKAPSPEELDHDFLWRVWRALPERGRIGVFNRSHYEEVLVVRVNPGFLDGQRLPRRAESLEQLWEERYESIRGAEQHWARNGTVVLKFFLNVSQEEQRKRLLERIDDPEANWKFEAGDLKVRAQWDQYMEAYEAALCATSRPWAPWYAIPADSKAYMRRAVAEIVAETMERMGLAFPTTSAEKRAELKRLREQLGEE